MEWKGIIAEGYVELPCGHVLLQTELEDGEKVRCKGVNGFPEQNTSCDKIYEIKLKAKEVGDD